ncbi:hypothetical protein D3C87_1244960 [compost metagenome]
MIQRLVFLRIVAVVGQGVVEGERYAAGFGDQFGRHGEVDFLERLLFQLATQADGVWRFFIDVQGDFVGRNVGGAAVQGQQFTVVHAGMADPFVAAAGDQLIETFQPAQATATIEFDEGRIDHFLDRRIPAHAHIADRGLQDVHAASRHHREFHRAVIDVDDADALLPTAVQGAQGHGEGFVGFHPELLAGDLPALGGFVGVEQDVIPGHGVGGGQRAKDNEEFERGHGESLSWSCAFFIALMKRFSKHKKAYARAFPS